MFCIDGCTISLLGPNLNPTVIFKNLIVVTIGSIPKGLGFHIRGQSAVALIELGGDKHLFSNYLSNLLFRWTKRTLFEQ